jgi:hypothetical protein
LAWLCGLKSIWARRQSFWASFGLRAISNQRPSNWSRTMSRDWAAAGAATVIRAAAIKADRNGLMSGSLRRLASRYE